MEDSGSDMNGSPFVAGLPSPSPVLEGLELDAAEQ